MSYSHMRSRGDDRLLQARVMAYGQAAGNTDLYETDEGGLLPSAMSVIGPGTRQIENNSNFVTVLAALLLSTISWSRFCLSRRVTSRIVLFNMCNHFSSRFAVNSFWKLSTDLGIRVMVATIIVTRFR